MAVHLFYGRILSASLAVSLVASLVVSVGTANPARADYYLTHSAEKPALAATPSAATLFKNGAEIGIKKDANIYLTPRSIPDNDLFLKAYNADRPDGGRAKAKAGEATAVPGLLGIANQTIRGRDRNGQNNQAYSLADAMRDAIWRKTTAARLRSLTTSMSACAKGAVKKTPSIGLATVC